MTRRDSTVEVQVRLLRARGQRAEVIINGRASGDLLPRPSPQTMKRPPLKTLIRPLFRSSGMIAGRL
ncbi:MAG: hypothetical protein H0W53_05020 [Acidobacteria bacterium]|nr:hypothetical protein [Acidobacteriota bacterium]